jgi:glycine/serine hydroxymethyltransferase
MNEPEMKLIASLIHEALTNREDKAKLESIRKRVVEINQGFPLP